MNKIPTQAASVAVAAGRRIDAPDATSRFPLNAVERVRREIDAVLRDIRPDVLIASAACGADLIALEAAIAFGARTRIVMPFEAAEFRRVSVTNRPGAWGLVFDRVLASTAREDVVIIAPPPRGWTDMHTEPYVAVNRAVIDDALRLSRAVTGSATVPVAIVAWDGTPRSADDVTSDFLRRARDAGFRERIISTS